MVFINLSNNKIAANREAAVEAGAITSIVNAVDKHTKTLEICDCGCDSIRVLATNSKYN